MKVLISGAAGMVGTEVFLKLAKRGDTVARLVRSVAAQSGMDIVWDGKSGNIDASRLEGFDAVVHLAGESIASGRWTEKRKQKIRDSRVIPTEHLSQHLSQLKKPPTVFIVASAIGYYGDRGEEVLDEQSKPGVGFLPDVCQAWEAATRPASENGIRTVNLRFGIILSSKGGALRTMLCPFKMGVGGIIGTGKQYMSWIALDDAVQVILNALSNPALQGPVNAVSPTPVTNREFTETLGKVLVRPTLLPMPAAAARLVLGEMADALLLSSAKVTPKKLTAAGYQFAWPKLEDALTVICRPK